MGMKKESIEQKKYSELTGKLHMPCPYKAKTGINVHIVIKEGVCYRTGHCLVVECKYNHFQGDLEKLLSVTW